MPPSPEFPPQPPVFELRRKLDRLAEHLGPRLGETYAHYFLAEPGAEPPEDEPTEIMAFACAYLPTPRHPKGQYMLLGEADAVRELPPRDALRRMILSFEVRPGAMDDQRTQHALWTFSEVSRQAVIEAASVCVDDPELPICFIALGKTVAEDKLTGLIFHPPLMSSDGALELIKESVELTMARG